MLIALLLIITILLAVIAEKLTGILSDIFALAIRALPTLVYLAGLAILLGALYLSMIEHYPTPLFIVMGLIFGSWGLYRVALFLYSRAVRRVG